MPGKTVCFLTRLVPEPGPTLLREGFTEVRGNFQDRRLSRDELLSGVSGVDALYCLLHDTIDAQIMDAAGPRLKVISNMAVGYDNIDVEAATERGVLVTNTPGVLTNATAGRPGRIRQVTGDRRHGTDRPGCGSPGGWLRHGGEVHQPKWASSRRHHPSGSGMEVRG